MSKLGGPKTIFVISVLCATAVIALPAQTLTTLVDFDGTNGRNPSTPLIQGTDGNFYGTTALGGAGIFCKHGCGTVFKTTAGGMLTTLYSFCVQTRCADGSEPSAGLVQATDGNFYGTTSEGGASDRGTVFKINPEGILTTLYNFCSPTSCTDGAFPGGDLVQATDGNFYGTTSGGGASNACGILGCGTVFKITPGGKLTTLHSFDGTDGASPSGGLVQAADGNFYGTTSDAGASRSGTVFKITPGGTLTTLHSFDYYTDGAFPRSTLVQATDGNFYGTTIAGGASNAGTVFKITAGGTLTTLHSFGGTDGATPYGVLVQASDGNFYGTTSEGGVNDACTGGCGTVFKVTPGGTLTTLHSFNGTDGANPYGGLLQATDANFYGTTALGGANDYGTVFSLSGVGAGVTFSPAALSVGGQVVGTTSAAHTLTLANSGTAALSISSIAVTNGFDQTNSCGTSLAAGASCTIDVTFTPTAAGEITGTLSITDNAPGSPQHVSLSGVGQDFAIGFSPTTETVIAGRAALYNLQIKPLGGFNQTVALSCSGAPQFASCVVSPASIAPANGPVGVSVKVTTRASSQTFGSAAAGRRLPPPPGPTKGPWLWLGELATGLLMVAARRRRLVLASALILLSVMTWVACGGGAAPSIWTPGTPNGTFTIVVIGTSGPVVHSATTTLVVSGSAGPK